MNIQTARIIYTTGCVLASPIIIAALLWVIIRTIAGFAVKEFFVQVSKIGARKKSYQTMTGPGYSVGKVPAHEQI